PGGAIAELARGGAQLIVNVNASPFEQGKVEVREAEIQARIQESGVPIVYINQVGGQDELVFDGGSMAFDATGQLVARAPQFVETTMVFDLEPLPATAGDVYPVEVVTAGHEGREDIVNPVAERPGPHEELWSALVLGTRDYVRKNGFTDVCLGLSGGVDSAAVAAIAVDALGAENVHTVAMPSRFSSDGSLSDAAKLAANLGCDHRVIQIEPAHAAFLDMLAASFAGREADVTEENLQSRIRGVVLMALANKLGWLVLTTGNKSETSVGYSTLYGDTAGAFAVIKDVWKLTLYELCGWRNHSAGTEVIPETVLTKAPSAELRPDQRDDQSLPPYEVLDPLLVELVERDRTAAELIGDGHDEAVVRRIARLIDIAEYKRRQNPLGPKVSTKAFGRDRRIPITNRYRGVDGS
ncbi:MAG: NAD+ synthase, partial [Acidimicrobiia bacterium]